MKTIIWVNSNCAVSPHATTKQLIISRPSLKHNSTNSKNSGKAQQRPCQVSPLVLPPNDLSFHDHILSKSIDLKSAEALPQCDQNVACHFLTISYVSLYQLKQLCLGRPKMFVYSLPQHLQSSLSFQDHLLSIVLLTKKEFCVPGDLKNDCEESLP